MTAKLMNDKDRAYWIDWEARIEDVLVDLADRGFACERRCFKRGLTDDPRCRVRPGVADALERAREVLPKGHCFLIRDAWRPWAVQEQLADRLRKTIAEAHPDWTEEQVDARLAIMAPRIRIIPSFSSHRYGGAVDLTIRDAEERELDMGTPMSYMEGPESDLLFFETAEDTTANRLFRDNRRLLIQAMYSSRFRPNLNEWWHWGFQVDFEAEGLV